MKNDAKTHFDENIKSKNPVDNKNNHSFFCYSFGSPGNRLAEDNRLFLHIIKSNEMPNIINITWLSHKEELVYLQEL